MYRDLDKAWKYYNKIYSMNNFSQKLLISTMKESGKILKGEIKLINLFW